MKLFLDTWDTCHVLLLNNISASFSLHCVALNGIVCTFEFDMTQRKHPIAFSSKVWPDWSLLLYSKAMRGGKGACPFSPPPHPTPTPAPPCLLPPPLSLSAPCAYIGSGCCGDGLTSLRQSHEVSPCWAPAVGASALCSSFSLSLSLSLHIRKIVCQKKLLCRPQEVASNGVYMQECRWRVCGVGKFCPLKVLAKSGQGKVIYNEVIFLRAGGT